MPLARGCGAGVKITCPPAARGVGQARKAPPTAQRDPLGDPVWAARSTLPPPLHPGGYSEEQCFAPKQLSLFRKPIIFYF